MDDRGWTWPAWKFGLKRDDLFTTLHDQYNTFPSSIQDPEAFHHDVWEISNTASTQDEFHAMLADRKELRLRELNETLESASFEIIANPKLIGTEQWQFAIQLFRTRSLDSLVGYFASYLPESHPWHHTHGDDDAQTSTTVSSVSDSLADSIDTIDSVSTADSGKPFFDDDDHDYLTHEPLTIHTTSLSASHLPPSPRSMTMCSNSSAVSPIDADPEDHVLGALTATRAVSYSDEEFDAAMDSGLPSQCDEDETSQDDDFDDTPFSSVSDIADIQHSHESRDLHAPAEYVELTGAAMESVEDDSETPTPRNEYNMKSYPLQEEPSKTMLPAAKASQQSSSPLYTQVLNEYMFRLSQLQESDLVYVHLHRAENCLILLVHLATKHLLIPMFLTYLKNSFVSGFERIKETLSLAEDKALESLPEPYIPTAAEIAAMPEKLREKATRALHGSDANPSMLGDPISLKAEQSDYMPGPDQEGAGSDSSSSSATDGNSGAAGSRQHRETLREKAAKKLHGPEANPSQLGDPISMKAESNDHIPKPEEEGARRNRDSKL